MYNYLHGQYELWLESPLYKRLQNEIEAESSAFYKLLDQQPAAFELVEDESIATEAYEVFREATKDLYDFSD